MSHPTVVLSIHELATKPHCPQCLASIDAVTGVNAGGNPKPGSITVCYNCAAALCYTENGFWRPVEESEIPPRGTRQRHLFDWMVQHLRKTLAERA